MPDLRKYWDNIRTLESKLPDFVWLTSLENPSKGQVGGRIAQVPASVAAHLLHAKSHRLASDAETQEYDADQEVQQREAFHQRLRRQGIAVVPVTAAPSAEKKVPPRPKS